MMWIQNVLFYPGSSKSKTLFRSELCFCCRMWITNWRAAVTLWSCHQSHERTVASTSVDLLALTETLMSKERCSWLCTVRKNKNTHTFTVVFTNTTQSEFHCHKHLIWIWDMIWGKGNCILIIYVNTNVTYMWLWRMCFCLSPSTDLDPVVVVPKESELMFKGEDLTASCNALSSLKTSTVWYKVRLYH